MARTLRRTFDDTLFDLFDDPSRPVERFTRLTFELSSRGPVDDIPPPLPLSMGFTDNADIVLFDKVNPGQFTSSYYNALNGNDFVILPADKAKAGAIGYDPTKIFNGDGGNDHIVGQGLSDLINGGRHNDLLEGRGGADALYGDTGLDQLFGGDGADLLVGGDGHDVLLGGAGNDVMAGGFGLDYADGGDGDDIIYSLEQDDAYYQVATNPLDGSTYISDLIYGGAGNDDIAATAKDLVFGGTGDDTIVMVAYGGAWASISGDNGNDTIVGSNEGNFIFTGSDLNYFPPEVWSLESKMLYGGFTDKVQGGDGKDTVNTMIFCNAEVDTGGGEDRVEVVGILDKVSTGAGNDTVRLNGGAGLIDLGTGDDTFVMRRPAYDNTNISQIKLGSGADRVVFETDEWHTNGDWQGSKEAPVVLDFNPAIDVIDTFKLTNWAEPQKSLDPDYVEVVQLTGGSAIVYDHPFDYFVFAKFSGVNAQDLAENIYLNATFV